MGCVWRSGCAQHRWRQQRGGGGRSWLRPSRARGCTRREYEGAGGGGEGAHPHGWRVDRPVSDCHKVWQQLVALGLTDGEVALVLAHHRDQHLPVQQRYGVSRQQQSTREAAFLASGRGAGALSTACLGITRPCRRTRTARLVPPPRQWPPPRQRPHTAAAPGEAEEPRVESAQHHAGRLHQVGHLIQQPATCTVGHHACAHTGLDAEHGRVGREHAMHSMLKCTARSAGSAGHAAHVRPAPPHLRPSAPPP